MFLSLALLLLTANNSGARLVLGSQRATYQVTIADTQFTLPNYRNNGFQQRVRPQDDRLNVVIAVGAGQLNSNMKGRTVKGLPPQLRKLERQLNKLSNGPFANQLTLIMSWLRTELVYNVEVDSSQDPLAVLRRGSGNCVGFTEVALMILRAMNVEARYVTGIAFRPDDSARRLLEGNVLHRWIEIKYEDVGWVFSDPAGKVNFVEATYMVMGVEGIHAIDRAKLEAVGSQVELQRLQNGLKQVGRLNGLDGRIRVRPNKVKRLP